MDRAQTPRRPVIIPYNGEPSRRWQYDLTRAYYTHLGYDVLTGCCDGWSKGCAVASVIGQAGERFAVCDADLLVAPQLLTQAFGSEAALTIPFSRVLNLDERGDVQKIRQRFDWAGGCWVLDRRTYDAVGGIDPRFEGWGGEDESFCRAVKILVGPVLLLEGDAWHLPHPPHPRKHTWKRTPSYRLYMRYRAATRREQMLKLIGERWQG